MIDIKINPGGYGIMAFVAHEDLLTGKSRFYLGGDKRAREHFYPEWPDDVIPDVVDIFIVHESLHLVIYKITRSHKTSHKLDKIDNCLTNFNISRSC